MRRRGVLGLRAADIRIELRRLAPIEPAVIAHDPNFAVAKFLDAVDLPWQPRVSGFGVFPRHQQRQFAGIIDTGVHVILGNGRGASVKPEVAWQPIGLSCKGCVPAWRDLGECYDLCDSHFRFIKAPPLDWRFLGRSGIGEDIANPQVIILENLESALLLHGVVLGLSAPAHDRFLVTPGRMRQYPSRPELAFEALVVDEAIDCFEDGLQVFCEFQILVLLALSGEHFKDHGKHVCSFAVSGGNRREIASALLQLDLRPLRLEPRLASGGT